jgi:MFS family permease
VNQDLLCIALYTVGLIGLIVGLIFGSIIGSFLGDQLAPEFHVLWFSSIQIGFIGMITAGICFALLLLLIKKSK